MGGNRTSRQYPATEQPTSMTSTPPRRGPNGHWNTPKRSQVYDFLDLGLTHCKISEKTGVSATIVGNWSREPHSRRNKTRLGYPPLVTKHDIWQLIVIVTKN